MSALGSTVGDFGAIIGSKGGTTTQTQYTKNQGIQTGLNSLISNYNTSVGQDSTDLNSYIKNYLSGTPQATRWAGQETGAIDRFYNGDVESHLKDLENQQRTLGNESVAQGLAYARGNQNRSQMAGGAGGASYLNRQAIGVGTDANLQNDLALLGQTRADTQYMDTAPVGFAGQRQNILNSVANRGMVPIQARAGVMGADASTLSSLSGINNSNNSYAYQYNPNKWQQWGNEIGDTGSVVQDVISAYASMYGGGQPQNFGGSSGTGSGGSPTGSQMGSLQTGFGPVATGYVQPQMQNPSAYSGLDPNMYGPQAYSMGYNNLNAPTTMSSWAFN